MPRDAREINAALVTGETRLADIIPPCSIASVSQRMCRAFALKYKDLSPGDALNAAPGTKSDEVRQFQTCCPLLDELPPAPDGNPDLILDEFEIRPSTEFVGDPVTREKIARFIFAAMVHHRENADGIWLLTER